MEEFKEKVQILYNDSLDVTQNHEDKNDTEILHHANDDIFKVKQFFPMIFLQLLTSRRFTLYNYVILSRSEWSLLPLPFVPGVSLVWLKPQPPRHETLPDPNLQYQNLWGKKPRFTIKYAWINFFFNFKICFIYVKIK